MAGVTALAGAITSWNPGITISALFLGAAAAGGLLAFVRRAPEEKEKTSALSQGPFSWSLPAALLAGLVVLLRYRASHPSVDLVGVLFVAGGAAVVGVFVGFLFGIPRIATRRAPTLPEPKPDAATEAAGIPGEARRLNPNTNLEEISDWLTKIIVGITLFEAGDLMERFDTLATNTATLGIPKAGAAAIVIYFSVAGFLAGYLWTRLVLTRQFAAGDRAADDAARESLRQAIGLEPSSDLASVFETLRRLIAIGEVQAAVNVGRDYLRSGQTEIASDLFLYLKEHAPPTHARYFVVLSNLGYSYIEQGEYDKAIEELSEAVRSQGLENPRPWHTVALAYAYFKAGRLEKYREWLEISRRLSDFKRSREELARRYREIAPDLLDPEPPPDEGKNRPVP